MRLFPIAFFSILLVTFSVLGNSIFSIFSLEAKKASAQTALDITQYQLTYGSRLDGITKGPDGNLWFVAVNTNKIGKITTGGSITEYSIPTANSWPSDIIEGPDGSLWFTEWQSKKIGKITTNGTLIEYPSNSIQGPQGITSGSDGNLWYTAYDKIFRITLSGLTTEFDLPSINNGATNIVTGADGNVWYTASNENKIGKITPNGIITEYSIPTANSSPQGITLGPDENLWFTEFSANKIGRITPQGVITEFSIPTPNSGTDGITVGSDGNLWFTESYTNRIGKISLQGEVVEYSIPGTSYGITSGSDQNLWFTMWDKIGRINISSVPQPTATLTQIPTPTSGGTGGVLNVPLFKQGIAPYDNNNPSWEDDEFDHANDGQFTCGTTMSQCGCSTTSIAMVLKYYKVNKLPDGTPLDPGTLNTWLKNNNGYNRNAGVIWSVAATVAKKAKAQNPDFAYNSIEYLPDRTYNTTTLTNDLQQGIPNILQVNAPGMHFVVATGKENNAFTINDPLFNRANLTSYNNSAVSVRKFVPAYSDMSYIVYVVDENMDIVVRDENGTAVGESYLEYSPSQLTQEPSVIESSAVKVYYLAKPDTGKYTVELVSPEAKNYQLDETVITEDGEVKADTFKGWIDPDKSVNYHVSYDKNDVSNSNTELIVTFDTLKSDLEQLYTQGQIKNKMVYYSLKYQVNFAEKASLANRQPLGNKLAILALKTFQYELNKVRGKSITEEAYQILYNDAKSLIESLQSGSGGNQPTPTPEPGGS